MAHPTNVAAGWYADPSGTPNQLRWWDGTQWTAQTQPGQPAPIQMPWQPQPQPQSADQARIQHQVQKQAKIAPEYAGGGTLFTEPVLVINQKTKVMKIITEYSVFDQHGRTMGTVVHLGESRARKVARFFFWGIDMFLTHRWEVRDASRQPVLRITRPRKFLRSKVLVTRADGQPVGEIRQQKITAKPAASFQYNGQPIGAIQAENWRAWSFAVVDHTGAEVARITETWEGLEEDIFTTADNYVLRIHRQLPDPLLTLVVASGLVVDTAVFQFSLGLD